jgi:hypothetical protein
VSKYTRCAAPNGICQRYDPVRGRDSVEVPPPISMAFLSRLCSTSDCEAISSACREQSGLDGVMVDGELPNHLVRPLAARRVE